MNKPNLEGKIEIDEVLLKAKEQTKEFIAHIEKEEDGERVETADSVRNQMLADRTNTHRKKLQFVEEIKNGLGQDIRVNHSYGVKFKKRGLLDRLKKFFITLFDKF